MRNERRNAVEAGQRAKQGTAAAPRTDASCAGADACLDGGNPAARMRVDAPACTRGQEGWDLAGYLDVDCAHNPDQMLFAFEDEIYTYARARTLASARAEELKAQGAGMPGAPLVVDAPNTPDFIITLLGAFIAHIPAVLLNHRLSETQKLERLAGLPDAIPPEAAVVIFTSGTTGVSKAVPLTQANLIGSARAACALMCAPRTGIWQLALPLFHVSGLQVLVRAIVNDSSLILYERCEAAALLADVAGRKATHVSVVDKVLRDMLRIDAEATASYRAILLGGGPLREETVEQSIAAGLNVYAGYGMTETSSAMAATRIAEGFEGALTLLDGYEARVADPDENGVGSLEVRGPGVMHGYLKSAGARGEGVDVGGCDGAFTDDGFFMTGDVAVLRGGALLVHERRDDLFISGGENVYPAQVERCICRVPGIAACAVFGASDPVWGRVPVALVVPTEREGFDLEEARAVFEKDLAPYERPRQVFVCDALPEAALGKTDRRAVQRLYRTRVVPARAVLHEIDQPFVTPFQTVHGRLDMRRSLIVEVRDEDGHVGYGEDVAFSTGWYHPETIAADRRALEQVLVPHVLQTDYLEPRQIAADLEREVARAQAAGVLSGIDPSSYEMAIAAVECAIWDLYGRANGVSMQALIGADASRPARAGAVIGLMPVAETLRAATRAVAQGFRRIKIKVVPGHDIERVRAVRAAYPDLLIMLDANQSYAPDQIGDLEAMASLDIACIEEPLAMTRDASGEVSPRDAADTRASRPSHVAAQGLVVADTHLAQLSRAQERLSIPLCIDESAPTAAAARRALGYGNLRMFVMKVGRMGGIRRTLDFIEAAQAQGAHVWMGGMFDTSISKRLHAVFEQLPGIDMPGDIAPATRYFAHDIAEPPLVVADGLVEMSVEDGVGGLGVDFNEESLARVEVSRRAFDQCL